MFRTRHDCLLDDTSLSTPVSNVGALAIRARHPAPRLALSVLMGTAALSMALPAAAANFNVANESQLNNAISNAGNGDTITFTANITLSANLPAVTKNVTVNGGNFSLSGNNQYRGLYVQSGSVAINDLRIESAKAQGGKGGNGDTGSGGGGGAGLGGALFVGSSAHVSVSNVSLQYNVARGGDGGASSGSGTAGGGGGMGLTGADGGNGGVFVSGGGGTGGGGDGSTNGAGSAGGFGGGGGGGGGGNGGTGGFGGGGGGSGANAPYTAPGGFLGGAGGRLSEASNAFYNGGGGGGAGMGGAIFVQEGGTLSLAGTLNVSGNAVAGGAAGTGVYLSAGHAGGSAGAGMFLMGNGTLTLAPGAGQTQTIADAITDQAGAGGTGAWSLVKNAPGTTILLGANAYAGGTTVNSGILQGNTGSLQGKIVNNATVVFQQTGAGSYAGDMSGTGTVTVNGTGDVTLAGTNTYSGGTTVTGGGRLLFTSDASLGAAGKTISVTDAAIGVGTGAGGQTFARPVTIAGSGGFFVDESVTNPVTWSGAIDGTGMLVKSGGGRLVLSGAKTYSGGTEVTGGFLLISDDASLGAAGTGITLNVGGIGTVKEAPASLTIGRAITLVDRGSVYVDNNPLTVSGPIGGSGQLIKDGAGALILTGTNTYSGGTFVARGTLQIASDDKLGTAGTGVTLYNNAALFATESFATSRHITLLGAGGTLLVNGGKTLTLTGTVDGTNILKVGDGTLILAGNSAYSGVTQVFQGILQGNTITVRGDIVFDESPLSKTMVFDQATEGTFAGNIAGVGTTNGSGAVVKNGAGKLTLTGTSKYTGGTTVNAGILEGTSNSLQGVIVNNAAVIFNQAFDGTYAGDVTGTGTLAKNGSGKLRLDGTSSVGGGTAIDGGTLSVNGHLTSNVTVNKGGTLSGVGNITGDITNNGGTIRPGNSIGHLTVNGNFTFAAGTYDVELNAQGDSDRVSVIGAGHKVNISAGTLVIQPDAGTYMPNTKYTIITTEAGGNVHFDNVTGGVGFLTPQVSLDQHNVYVSLVLAPNAFRSAGQTINQQAVGGALDALAAGGTIGGLVTAMANLPTAQGASAFQALSGQPYADFGTLNIRASQLFMNAVGRQMAVNRGAGLGGASSVALAEACDVACDTAPPSRFSAWLSGIGSTGSVLGDANASGVTYTMGGTAFGIDYRLDPRFLVGIAGGYVGGTQWVNGFSGNGYTDALSFAVYGSFTQNGSGSGFYVDALAGYANASNRLQRVVSIPNQPTGIASGSTSANQFLGQIETGYKVGLGIGANASVTPFGRLQIGTVNQAGFTEGGQSFFNLSVASQTTTSVRTTFGADLAASFDLGGGTPLDIGVRLGWMHEFADTSRPITAAFAAAPGPQFTVWGATPARDSAVIGVSAATAVGERTSLFVAYDGEVGGGTDNHQLRAGFRFTW
ncbi:MAG: autotransporter domain-containing protein [Reyranella sp.]|uniref:autotransporter domain-containing protein n=1 Tax=Reyranella sp. TaxID=1929291 RepID=UPI0025F43924|nr:autotransporter domain-containing protein [Reyranella sp.]MBR2813669.1 autotransporter domain-containing protein [Reyranella sp.]